MSEQYRCYFIDRDGKGRTLATIGADSPSNAIEIAKQRFQFKAYCKVEVWDRRDRVLVCEDPRAHEANKLEGLVLARE